MIPSGKSLASCEALPPLMANGLRQHLPEPPLDAETKLRDLNAHDVEAAMLQIEGTARSMGIEVV